MHNIIYLVLVIRETDVNKVIYELRHVPDYSPDFSDKFEDSFDAMPDPNKNVLKHDAE